MKAFKCPICEFEDKYGEHDYCPVCEVEKNDIDSEMCTFFDAEKNVCKYSGTACDGSGDNCTRR